MVSIQRVTGKPQWTDANGEQSSCLNLRVSAHIYHHVLLAILTLLAVVGFSLASNLFIDDEYPVAEHSVFVVTSLNPE